MSSLVYAQVAKRAEAITPSDTASNVFSYIYVGGTGDLTITTEGGDTVTLVGLPVGSFVWVSTSKVMDTDTTATDLVGFN